MPIPELEHMLVAQKASSEVLAAIMRTSFEGMQRLAELNMAAAKEVMSNSATSANTLPSLKDMGDMSRFSAQMAKPERVMEYWRSVYDQVNAMQKDVTALMQANYSQLAKSAASAIEQKKSSGLDGSDVMAGAMKDMLAQTTKAFDNMTAVASQMAGIAGANFKAATATASTAKPAAATGESAKKK